MSLCAGRQSCFLAARFQHVAFVSMRALTPNLAPREFEAGPARFIKPPDASMQVLQSERQPLSHPVAVLARNMPALEAICFATELDQFPL